jgi:hypothetical protein
MVALWAIRVTYFLFTSRFARNRAVNCYLTRSLLPRDCTGTGANRLGWAFMSNAMPDCSVNGPGWIQYLFAAHDPVVSFGNSHGARSWRSQQSCAGVAESSSKEGNLDLRRKFFISALTFNPQNFMSTSSNAPNHRQVGSRTNQFFKF